MSQFGRPTTYPLRGMEIGEEVEMEADTAADVKRIARNVSQYGARHDRFYRCRTNPITRIMTITRIR